MSHCVSHFRPIKRSADDIIFLSTERIVRRIRRVEKYCYLIEKSYVSTRITKDLTLTLKATFLKRKNLKIQNVPPRGDSCNERSTKSGLQMDARQGVPCKGSFLYRMSGPIKRYVSSSICTSHILS